MHKLAAHDTERSSAAVDSEMLSTSVYVAQVCSHGGMEPVSRPRAYFKARWKLNKVPRKMPFSIHTVHSLLDGCRQCGRQGSRDYLKQQSRSLRFRSGPDRGKQRRGRVIGLVGQGRRCFW